MGVTGELQVRPVSTLSGGQRSRIALALITYEEPHLLLLDEPTNHQDLDTVQALIRALSEFQGGVLVVSHDEHLITAVCDELWIVKDRRVVLSEGDFDDYKESVLQQFRAGTKHEGAL
jgi:ATP-binding cassette subfamily F protein 3